jgi:hypothetical protein
MAEEELMAEKDPVAKDIQERGADTGDQVAGEQVLGERAAPEPDELIAEADEDRRS